MTAVRRTGDPVEPGERLFILCEGGPCATRLVKYPPPLEVVEREGLYVLVDDGAVDDWRYVFVSRS